MFVNNLLFKNLLFYLAFYVSAVKFVVSGIIFGSFAIAHHFGLCTNCDFSVFENAEGIAHVFFVVSVIYLWLGYTITIFKKWSDVSFSINLIRVLLILFPLPSVWLFFVFTYNKPIDMKSQKREFENKDQMMAILNLETNQAA